jgi:hypothetical protein
MGRKPQEIFDYSKNSETRRPNYSPPLLSSFAAEITTPYPASYNSIITSTPKLPTESTNVPALLYSVREYTTTEGNWTPHFKNFCKHICALPVLSWRSTGH